MEQGYRKKTILFLLAFLLLFSLSFLIAFFNLKRGEGTLNMMPYKIENWLIMLLAAAAILKVLRELHKI